MSLLPHISQAPDLKANAGCSLGVSGAPRLLDKSLSYTPLPLPTPSTHSGTQPALGGLYVAQEGLGVTLR